LESHLGLGWRLIVQHSLFALEVCARMDLAPSIGGLREVIARHPVETGHMDKWNMYRHCVELVLANLAYVERGCWDFFDDDARALGDYEGWCQGMLAEETARAAPSGRGEPRLGDVRYLTFTMAFLLVQGSECERALARLTAIPEAQLWQRATFAKILKGLGVLNFASVKSDVLYLIPRDDGWGLTPSDLGQPKFAYLRRLV